MPQAMHFYMDTHDQKNGTFPGGIGPEALADFYRLYEEACEAEGVVSLRIHVGFAEGRAFCFNMAPDVDAVKRVHERVGLPYDSITEVNTISPADLLLMAKS